MLPAVRHEQQPREQCLGCQDYAFDHGDRTRFSYCSVTRWFDALSATPLPEAHTVKLLPTIAYDVSRCGSCLGNRASQECSDGVGRWLTLERSDSHHPAREMIHDDSDPPCKRPRLRKRQWKPWCPETTSGYHREINMPHVVAIVRSNDVFLWRGFGINRRHKMARLLFEHTTPLPLSRMSALLLR